MIVTVTHATEWFLPSTAVEPGALVAAIGADSPGKHELEPALLERADVVVDVEAQCRQVGELQHCAPDAPVAATLGEVIAGRHPGRSTDRSVVVFDSTGTGFQDAAIGAAALRAATAAGRGSTVEL